MEGTKTTLWRSVAGGLMPVAELEGLPEPVPKIGFRVMLHEYGEGVCVGYGYEDPEKTRLNEVKLLVRSQDARKLSPFRI